MININELTTDHKIKLKKPMGCFDNLGEICEIIKIDTDENVINFRFGANGVHLGVMSGDELEKYFDVIEPAVAPDDYDWHTYGFIERESVIYRANPDGGICMEVSYDDDSRVVVTYRFPERERRSFQNGEQGKFHEDDLEIAYCKLLSNYYSKLYNETKEELELMQLENLGLGI